MVTNEDSLFNASLDLLAELREKIADGKVQCTGYHIARQRRKFTYTIEVEEPFAAAFSGTASGMTLGATVNRSQPLT